MEKESKKPLLEEFTVQQMRDYSQEGKLIPSSRRILQTQPASMQKNKRAIENVPQFPSAINVPSAPIASSIFDKVNSIISNPDVTGLECTGTNKPLMINRQGMIQASNISLSEEEIKSFLQDLSGKTKIPLLPGIFKVTYQNLNITAFISEFVGSKFLIQKKQLMPYRPQYRF